MTNPTGDEVRLPGTDGTANVSKQPAGEQNEGRTVEEKDLPPPAAISIGQPQQLADLKLRREEVYRARLELFWAAAHENSPLADNAEEREVFFNTMLQVSNDDLTLLTDGDQEGVHLPAVSIRGDIQEVGLEVADLLTRNPPLDEVAAFLRSSISATIARLERAGEGTPELRVDIVARVLFLLRGSPAASNLACQLYRYLQSQEEREAGFYETVLNLAVIVSAGGSEYVAESAFLYHSMLDGLLVLGESGRLGLDEVRGNEGARMVVSKAAANISMIIVRRVREMSSGDRARAGATLRDLKSISAVTFSVPSFTETTPHAIAEALRISTSQPGQFLASIMDLAPTPEAWEVSNITTSWLEAAGGVAAAATGGIERAVDLFFNAGISLRDQSVEADGQGEGLRLRARMLINLVGLRLSLKTGQDLHTSLVELDGIDCAINFVSSFVDYRAADERVMMNTASSVEPLARELVHFAKWPLLRGAERRLDRGRLERAATALGITVEERTNFPELNSLVDRTVDVLRSSFGLEPAGQDNLIIDTANIVGSLYSSVLVAEDTGRLQSEVDELVAARENAVQVLVELYRPYASTAQGEVGPGPAVVAGVITEAEWRGVAERLTDPVDSVVSAIAEFPTDRRV